MTNQLSFFPADRCDRDQFTGSQTGERLLNAAIVHAKIAGGFEEYLEIFDAFYADDVEISSETGKEPIRGKATVRSLLYNFLAPLHVMAEVTALTITIRATPIPGDAACATHSAWTLVLAGVSGTTCTLSWSTLRKWNGSRIVSEHHYDYQQSGEPLTLDDFEFHAAKPAAGFRRPS
jgi:hypothetical protein